MNLVIAGTDPVAVDAVGAAVIDIQPTDVKHLLLTEKKGLGTCNLEEITVLGELMEKVKRKFTDRFHQGPLFTSAKKLLVFCKVYAKGWRAGSRKQQKIIRLANSP